MKNDPHEKEGSTHSPGTCGSDPQLPFDAVVESRKWKERVASEAGPIGSEESARYFSREAADATLREALGNWDGDEVRADRVAEEPEEPLP